MKRLTWLIAILILISCKGKKGLDNKSDENNSFLWTITLSNGTQETANQMTQTKYVFLTNSDDKNELCNGTSFINETAYRELWNNNGSIQNPVWALELKNRELLKAKQVIEIACGNEDAQFGIEPASRKLLYVKAYPEFQQALK